MSLFSIPVTHEMHGGEGEMHYEKLLIFFAFGWQSEQDLRWFLEYFTSQFQSLYEGNGFMTKDDIGRGGTVVSVTAL